MTARNISLSLVGIAGLLVALAPGSAVASIIAHDGLAGPSEDLDAFLDAIADVSFVGSGSGEGMTPAQESPTSPSNEEDDPRPSVDVLALAPGGPAAGQPGSASQGGGNGSPSAALDGAHWNLPPAPLQTRLPKEGRVTMSTGPPFELLRPPRSGFEHLG